MEEIKAVLIELDAAYNKVEELKKKVNELSLARVKKLSGLQIGDKVEVNILKDSYASAHLKEKIGMVRRFVSPIKDSHYSVKCLIDNDFKLLNIDWNEYKLEVNKIKKDGTMSEIGIYYKGCEFESRNFTFTKL